MKIKKLIKYYFFGESLKEIEMNRILDKISKNSNLTKREKNFLDLYNFTITKVEFNDYMMLSKYSTSSKIKELLELNKVIICNLHDRDGKFGLSIIDLIDNIEEDYSTVFMKGGESHKLEDKFLYNLIYNIKKDEYSLEEHDEYFEKIESSND